MATSMADAQQGRSYRASFPGQLDSTASVSDAVETTWGVEHGALGAGETILGHAGDWTGLNDAFSGASELAAATTAAGSVGVARDTTTGAQVLGAPTPREWYAAGTPSWGHREEAGLGEIGLGLGLGLPEHESIAGAGYARAEERAFRREWVREHRGAGELGGLLGLEFGAAGVGEEEELRRLGRGGALEAPAAGEWREEAAGRGHEFGALGSPFGRSLSLPSSDGRVREEEASASGADLLSLSSALMAATPASAEVPKSEEARAGAEAQAAAEVAAAMEVDSVGLDDFDALMRNASIDLPVMDEAAVGAGVGAGAGAGAGAVAGAPFTAQQAVDRAMEALGLQLALDFDAEAASGALLPLGASDDSVAPRATKRARTGPSTGRATCGPAVVPEAAPAAQAAVAQSQPRAEDDAELMRLVALSKRNGNYDSLAQVWFRAEHVRLQDSMLGETGILGALQRTEGRGVTDRYLLRRVGPGRRMFKFVKFLRCVAFLFVGKVPVSHPARQGFTLQALRAALAAAPTGAARLRIITDGISRLALAARGEALAFPEAWIAGVGDNATLQQLERIWCQGPDCGAVVGWHKCRKGTCNAPAPRRSRKRSRPAPVPAAAAPVAPATRVVIKCATPTAAPAALPVLPALPVALVRGRSAGPAPGVRSVVLPTQVVRRH